MTTIMALRVRYGGRLPIGSIVIPEFDINGTFTGKASLVCRESLEEIDPPVWFVVGPYGYHIKYRGDTE